MAGFLRKKSKQPDVPTKSFQSSQVSLSSTTSPPPLFARFATTAKDVPPAPRIVSSPMLLSSNVRKDPPQRGASRAYPANSQAGGRDAEVARRRTQDQVTQPHPSSRTFSAQNQSARTVAPPAQGPQARTTAQAPLRPVSRVPMLDKPLPSPIFNDDPGTLTPSFLPTPPVTRPAPNRAPPPSFHAQQQGRSRASLDIADRDNKPLPLPASAQSQRPTDVYINASSPPVPTKSDTPPPRRNLSVSNSNLNQNVQPVLNRKMQPALPASFGHQNLPMTDANPPALVQAPPLRPMMFQDFQPAAKANGNTPPINGGTSSKRMSYVAHQEMPRPQEGTPVSDRGVDLPPEFALFQEFNETILNGRDSTHTLRPPTTVKTNQQVPGSSNQRSSLYSDSQFITSLPSTPLLSSSPPLPPPPSSSRPTPARADMGVAISHTTGSDVFSTSFIKDFHPPRANVRASQYGYNDPIPNNRPGRTSSPPLPPGAALPTTNFQVFPPRTQNAPIPDRMQSPPSVQPPPSYSNPIPHHSQPVPVSVQYQSQSPPQPADAVPVPVTVLRKSSSIQAATAPMRGKPRIFAAMAAQEDEIEPPALPPVVVPHQPLAGPVQFQNHVKKRPSQTQLGQQRQLQQVADQRIELEQAATRSHSPFAPPQHQQHSQVKKRPSQTQLAQQRQEQQPPYLQSDFTSFTNGSGLFDTEPWQSSSSLDRPSAPPSEAGLRTPKSNGSRSLPRQDEAQLLRPQTPPRTKKLSKSKPRAPADVSSIHMHPNGSNVTIPGTPDSQRMTHQRQGSAHRTKVRPTTPISPNQPLPAPLEPAIQLDEATIRHAGIPLDDDPFARIEGVTLMKPLTPSPSLSKESGGKKHKKGSLKGPSVSSTESFVEETGGKEDVNVKRDDLLQVAEPLKGPSVIEPLTPVSPDEPRKKRKKRREPKPEKEEVLEPPFVEAEVVEEEPREPITMMQFLSDCQLLSSLLPFLSFYDWCVLSGLSREIRMLLVRTPQLREVVLERFLKTVGYSRWTWDNPDPLSLSLQDLSDYMRGVSTPTHEYARVAGMYVHSLSIHPNHRDPSLVDTVRNLTASTRAYTRVLLRLRAQAEKEASLQSTNHSQSPPLPPSSSKSTNFASPARGGSSSRVSSRAPSPTTSTFSHGGHALGSVQQSSSQTSLTFRSPLFRLRRAPLLRVFVPSPEGDWLSDKSVLECEAECKRAGVSHLMRLGDVVWDVAVGDEGNVGRLVWDGSYLIDLDYTFSPIGDLPKYMPTLAFPPSYFHRVIRTGPNVSNPIVHVDISPWGEEIAMNLQLLQDRVRTETPQGAYHNVVRWVHRSSFSIRPPRGPQRYAHQSSRSQPVTSRIPIPGADNLFVDSGWYGTIVVETEGTNEALADLQDRCGSGAFPPRSRGVNGQINQAQVENRKVWRILREKSRPGEIWIKAVGVKERLL